MKTESPPTANPGFEAPVRGTCSRLRIAVKLGCVFRAGWVLSWLQTGLSGAALTTVAWPVIFGVRSLTSDYDMAAVCLAVTALAAASITFSIVRQKLVGISYASIVVYWLWTYSLLAIPF